MMSIPIKVKLMPGAEGGVIPWVLVKDDFRKQWIKAAEILNETPLEFDRVADAETYGGRAMKFLLKKK